MSANIDNLFLNVSIFGLFLLFFYIFGPVIRFLGIMKAGVWIVITEVNYEAKECILYDEVLLTPLYFHVVVF